MYGLLKCHTHTNANTLVRPTKWKQQQQEIERVTDIIVSLHISDFYSNANTINVQVDVFCTCCLKHQQRQFETIAWHQRIDGKYFGIFPHFCHSNAHMQTLNGSSISGYSLSLLNSQTFVWQSVSYIVVHKRRSTNYIGMNESGYSPKQTNAHERMHRAHERKKNPMLLIRKKDILLWPSENNHDENQNIEDNKQCNINSKRCVWESWCFRKTEWSEPKQ